MKRILTEQDLTDNPELKEKGYKVGDEIEIPEPELKEDPFEEDEQKGTDAAKETFDPGGDEDTGGGAPPPNKPRG